MRNRKTVRRRSFAGMVACLMTATPSSSAALCCASSDRIEGLLLGGLIGDALGGPVEFSERATDLAALCQARQWGDERLTGARKRELAATLPLLSYAGIRDSVAPYGPWRASAPAGTLTDDSRHKIVLLRAIRHRGAGQPLRPTHIARQLVDFKARPQAGDASGIQKLNEEGFREYRYAARWLLGERDAALALPVERLWGGVNNCSGQMMFPPLAACYPGNPQAAYRAAWELDFIDAPSARDMLAALVAGLAEILDERYDQKSPAARYAALRESMASTDPFRQAAVPFAGRQLHRWLNKADELVEQAQGRPRTLYRLLEEEGRPVYWWDAHFTLLVPLTLLQLCELDPLAALHLTLDFGHDTDSYAQILGCLVGAIYGASIFPEPLQTAVRRTLHTDYEEDVSTWQSELQDYRNQLTGRQP